MNPIIWMLIETLGSLFASICVLRAYAWRVHLSPQNPVSQFVNAFTDWLVKPIGRLVKPTRQMDWPSAIAALLVALLVALLFYLLNGRTPSPGPVLLLGLIWLIRWSLYLMMGVIILMAIISLINPYAPLAPALNQLADPDPDSHPARDPARGQLRPVAAGRDPPHPGAARLRPSRHLSAADRRLTERHAAGSGKRFGSASLRQPAVVPSITARAPGHPIVSQVLT
jgi:YggT family protein